MPRHRKDQFRPKHNYDLDSIDYTKLGKDPKQSELTDFGVPIPVPKKKQ